MVATHKKAASVGRSTERRRTAADKEKGSTYFDVVRSLTDDPELKAAVDKTEERLERKKD